MEPSRTERGASTRERLIDAARSLFGERGFAATSTRAIAARAGCNLALISHHFGSKEGLLRAILDEGLEAVRRELSSVAASGDPPERRIERIIHFLVDHFAEHCSSIQIVHRELMQSNSAILADLQPKAMANAQIFVGILEELRSGGRLADVDPKCSAMLLMGLLQFHFIANPVTSRVLGPTSPELLAKLKGNITRIFLNGVLDAHDR